MNPSCVFYISRFLDLNHYGGDSNSASFLLHLYLKDLQRESNPSYEDSNPWHLSLLLLLLRFESSWWRFKSSSSSKLFRIEIWIQSIGIQNHFKQTFLIHSRTHIRIHSIGIQISFFKFPNLHFLELGFESSFGDSNPLQHLNLFCFCLINTQTNLNPINRDSNSNTRKHVLSVRWWSSLMYILINPETLN